MGKGRSKYCYEEKKRWIGEKEERRSVESMEDNSRGGDKEGKEEGKENGGKMMRKEEQEISR